MLFNQLSIKRKVMAVTMLTSIIVLALTVTAFMIYDLVTFRSAQVRNLSTIATITAANSTASLTFKTEKEARETLNTLKAESQVIEAAIYDETGNLFVRYPEAAPVTDFPLKPGPIGHHFEPGRVIFFVPIAEGESRLGTLYLKSDLRSLYERLRLYVGIALLVTLGAVAVAFLISQSLQKRITEPILSLAETARVISEERDYSVRARKVSSDELGLLTDAFNQMLRRIEDQTLALAQSEKQLRLALEASRTGTWDWHMATGKMVWDEYNQRLFGLEPGQFAGTLEAFLALIYPEDRAQVENSLNTALEKKAEFNSEFRLMGTGPPARTLVARGRAQYNERGEPLRMNGVMSDITMRKQAEAVQSFLAAIVESSDDAIVGKDLDGSVVSWNTGAERMFGYSADEIIGQPIGKVLSPDRPEEETEILNQVRKGSIRHMETIRFRKDGKPINVSLTVSPIRNSRQQIIGMSSVARDITEGKAAAAELEHQSGILREQAQMLDLANVLARDLNDHIILWNSGSEKMYGWTRAQALGKVSHELFATQTSQPLEEIREALFSHGHWEGELTHRRKDGQTISVMSQWVLYRDKRGVAAAILEVNNDVSERKKAEEQILKMNAELEQRVQIRTAELTAANRELEAFTYSVAHDLRAPLRHIDAFSKILHDDFSQALPVEANRFLENIRNGSRNMSRLVDDLLNLARVGRQELRRQPTPLQDLVEEVKSDLSRETEGRKIDWKINTLPVIECDPGLMKQVFANLLSNAVKYTRPRSTAVIEIGQEKVNGHNAIFVRDNGVGFNMRYADKLFGVFQRLHRAEDFEGTGVGLATVERIVRKHGGSIWAEAELDRGATFYFTIANGDKPPHKRNL
jgi:PAS domain S-box-containing protein